ncbi:MAG: ComF family protein [Bacillota bacterium]
MRSEKILSELMEGLLDFVYPRNIFCMLCGEAIQKTEEYSLCDECRGEIGFIHGKACSQCGKPLELLYLPDQCHDCIRSSYHFDRGLSCVLYDENMKKLIYRFKYGGDRYLSYSLAQIMTDQLKKAGWTDIDGIIPVPLHRKKEKIRGFNQAKLLAQYISKFTGIPVYHKVLKRVKETQSQSALSRDERKDNLKNAFQLIEPAAIYNKRILLIDDIYTTGSTLNSCSKELRKGKPKEILVSTLAIGKNS